MAAANPLVNKVGGETAEGPELLQAPRGAQSALFRRPRGLRRADPRAASAHRRAALAARVRRGVGALPPAPAISTSSTLAAARARGLRVVAAAAHRHGRVVGAVDEEHRDRAAVPARSGRRPRSAPGTSSGPPPSSAPTMPRGCVAPAPREIVDAGRRDRGDRRDRAGRRPGRRAARPAAPGRPERELSAGGVAERA